MEWSNLAVSNDHDFLCIEFPFQGFPGLGIAVSNGEQDQAKGIEITPAEIGNIPAEFIIYDFADLTSLLCPGVGRPLSERGQVKTTAVNKFVRSKHAGINF